MWGHAETFVLACTLTAVCLCFGQAWAAGAGDISFTQRLMLPRARDFTSAAHVNLDVYNAFVFASVQPVDSADRVYYFRSVFNSTTLPVEGQPPAAPLLCEVPQPPSSQLYRGAYAWNSAQAEQWCMTGGTGESALSMCLSCSPVTGTVSSMVLADGPDVRLRFRPYGQAYEFNTSLLATGERVVYREVLAQVSGEMFGVAVTGWGGMDAYFGDKSFGESFLFNDVEEDWLLWGDAPGTGASYGLVLAGAQGFAGGYIGVQNSTTGGQLLTHVNRTTLTVDPSCYNVPDKLGVTATASVPSQGQNSTVVHLSFQSYHLIDYLSGPTPKQQYNWTAANRLSPAGDTVGDGWWEHHPPRRVKRV